MHKNSTHTEDSYPLLTDYTFNNNASDYGFMIYGDLNQNSQPGWFTMGTQYGNLCIQAVVKGGSYSDDDLSIVGGVPQTIYQKWRKYGHLNESEELRQQAGKFLIH